MSMKRTIIMSLTALPLLLVAGSNDLSDEGVGTYTDASVANQISNFSINRQMVSCEKEFETQPHDRWNGSPRNLGSADSHHWMTCQEGSVTGSVKEQNRNSQAQSA